MTAHLYTPKNDSLEERIRVYKATLEAQRNIDASSKLMDDEEWSSRLGTDSELRDAKLITGQSLDMAVSAIDASEISIALEGGLLTKEEASTLESLKNGKDDALDDRERIIQERKDSMREFRAGMDESSSEVKK